MQTHRQQFPDDRTTPEVGRMDKAAKAAAESPDPVTRAVLRQWLYQEGLAAQQGPTGTDLGDIEFAALSGDVGPTVR